jgi:hypothetical protein
MQRVDHQTGTVRGTDVAARGMLITVPVALLLWLVVIALTYGLSRWVSGG